MKRILIAAVSLALFGLGVAEAVQTCQRTDFFCYESGPSQNLLTPARLDANGNLTLLGNEINLSNTILGATGTGISSLSTASNIATSIPVLVSSGISQGMAIVAVAPNVTGSVNGTQSTTSGATTVLGVADSATSSGTVVNVDFSGLSLALTSGTVTVGDLLVTTVTWPGYLVTNNSAAAGAIVGTALATNASTYNGLTRVLLHH